MKEYFHHEIFRDNQGKFAGAATIAITVSLPENTVRYGVAFCAPTDNFSKRKGRTIAATRMRDLGSLQRMMLRHKESPKTEAELRAICPHLSQVAPLLMKTVEPTRENSSHLSETEFISESKQWRESLYSQFAHCMNEIAQVKNTPHWFRQALQQHRQS